MLEAPSYRSKLKAKTNEIELFYMIKNCIQNINL
jgi:hypothetical protein